jgi:hypothetical protein
LSRLFGFWLNETDQMNQINQINKTNQTNQINQIASGRGEVRIMPQDMVPSPYNPKVVLRKIPHKPS